jgi:hypothetical protein
MLTVLRRLDCVLEATKPKVRAEFAAKKKEKLNPAQCAESLERRHCRGLRGAGVNLPD